MSADSWEKKVKHLEMIERIIERMGRNSFQLKGWTVALVTAIIALSTQETNGKTLILSIIPSVAFWLLDSFYLQVERKYRKLYEIIAKKDENEIDFNMDTKIIEVPDDEESIIAYGGCFFSKTELSFYGAIITTIAGFELVFG